jgi:hypothetical protein
MDSGALIYVLSFIKIALGIQKLIEGDSHTHRLHGDCISLNFIFFLNKEVDPL